MFGQYGMDEASGSPYAETYLVDNKRNAFVKDGAARKSFDAKLEPGQDASGAFYALFADQVGIAKKYKIDSLKPGRLLYLLVDGQEPPASLSFRDFKTGAAYEIALNQKTAESPEGVSSSFGIAVTVAGQGRRHQARGRRQSRHQAAGGQGLRYSTHHRRPRREDPSSSSSRSACRPRATARSATWWRRSSCHKGFTSPRIPPRSPCTQT